MVRRFFRSSASTTWPFSTTTEGRPHSRARNRMDLVHSTERMEDSPSRTTMGISPDSKGMPLSCMGTEARSAMMRVSTSSEGSSWPIWCLPSRRMPTMIKR